jgi:two-component system sensor histidine kinase KdpD
MEHCREQDRELLQSVVDESDRLTRLVENLLDMARLDSGTVSVNKQWHVLEEIVGVALEDVKRELLNYRVAVSIPIDFPLLNIDGFLIERVFVNLLENASRYTPIGSQIEITATSNSRSAEIRVADNGPGLPPGSEDKIFDKFFRGSMIAPDGRRGVGLGLAICRAIVEALGGKINARNRSQGGAEFIISLPRDEPPPEVVVEPEGASSLA